MKLTGNELNGNAANQNAAARIFGDENPDIITLHETGRGADEIATILGAVYDLAVSVDGQEIWIIDNGRFEITSTGTWAGRCNGRSLDGATASIRDLNSNGNRLHVYSAHFCIPDTFVAGVDTNPTVSNEDQQEHICNIKSNLEANVVTGKVVIGADFNDINIPSGESIIRFLEGTGALNAGFCSETTLSMTDAVSTDVTHIMGTGGLEGFSDTGRGNPSFGQHGYVVASIELETSVDNLVGIHPYSVNDRGDVSLTSAGSGETLSVGYARIQPSDEGTTPSSLAIFGFRQNGTLISEASVRAAPPMQEGRIFAEVNGPVNTGLAVANPGDGAAIINFFFTDSDGINFGSVTFELGAHRQTAKFLNQEPFSSGDEVLGTFTFSSSVPISVIALRGFTNEQSEFLMTTLPITPLSSTSSDTIYFPHFADGGGWTTQVVLVNPTDSTVTGTVQFLGPGSDTMAALPVDLILDDGSFGSNFAYSIPARSSRRFTTSNPDVTTLVGSLRATSEGGSSMPSGLVIFSFASGGVTLSEAGVPALPARSAFRVYVEASGIPGQVGSVRSGIAITDTSGASNTVTLELTNVDGSLAMASQTLSIPPSGQVASFLDELFSLPDNFSGILRVTSTSTVAMVGLRLRVNERSEIKTTTPPPSNEASAATSVDTYFPHIVDSDGWSTEFILFNGTAGQTSSGTLSLFDETGQPLDLELQDQVVTLIGFEELKERGCSRARLLLRVSRSSGFICRVSSSLQRQHKTVREDRTVRHSPRIR